MSYQLIPSILSANILFNQNMINLENQNSHVYACYKQEILPHVDELINIYLRPQLSQALLKENTTHPICIQLRIEGDGTVLIGRTGGTWETIREARDTLTLQHPIYEIISKTNRAYRLIAKQLGTKAMLTTANQSSDPSRSGEIGQSRQTASDEHGQETVMRHTLANIESKIASNIEKRQQLQLKIDQKENELANLRKMVDDSQDMLQSMVSFEHKIGGVRQETSQLQQNMAIQEQALQSVLNEMTALKQTLQLAEKKKAEDTLNLQQNMASLQSVLNEMTTLKDKISGLHRENNEGLVVLRQEISGWKRETSQLQQSIASKENVVAHLEQKIAHLKAEKDKWMIAHFQTARKRYEQEDELVTLNQKISCLEEEKLDTKNAFQSTFEQLTVLKKINEQRSKEMSALRLKMKDKEDVVATLEEILFAEGKVVAPVAKTASVRKNTMS